MTVRPGILRFAQRDKLRILLLMAHAGGGHRSVSMALKDALLRVGPEGTEVVVADLLALGRPSLLEPAVRLYGPVIRHAPALYGGVYHVSEHPLVYPALRAATHDTFTHGLERLINNEQPAAVVSVYPLANRPLLDALEGLSYPAPAIAVVTELVSIHPSWAEEGFAHWATATDEARDAVLRFGVEPDRVSRFGLPVDSRFGRVDSEPKALRLEMGLDPERATVLVMAGAEGAARFGRLVPAIASASPEAQLIVVCGNNRRAEKRLTGLHLPVAVKFFGFVNTMPQLMHAADVVVTKGGPTSIAEALASGRPMVVFDALPGQEEGNPEFVERHGVGFDGRTVAGVRVAVRRLVSDEPLREAMAARAGAMARPDAAEDTARMVLRLAGAPPLVSDLSPASAL